MFCNKKCLILIITRFVCRACYTRALPQGSVLGPVLFLLYLNELFSQKFLGYISGYVDDLKLLSVRGIELQADIKTLTNWLILNKLSINSEKCSVIHVKGKRPFKEDGIKPSIESHELSKFNDVVDLGVRIDDDMSFRSHAHHVRSKSYRMINLCFKIFSSKNADLYIYFYKTYVISIIEYCFSVYSSTSISNINSIERIQRYFTNRLYSRLFPGSPKISYKSRLDFFNLHPLETHLYKIDLLNMYRLLHNDLPLPGVGISRSTRRPNRIYVSKVNSSYP